MSAKINDKSVKLKEQQSELTAVQEIKNGLAKLTSSLREPSNRRGERAVSEVFEGLLAIVNSLNDIFNDELDGSDTVFTSSERRGKLGTGIKSFGFSQAAYNSAVTNQILLPSYLSLAKFGEDISDVTLLQQVYNSLHQLDVSVSDTLYLYSDRAYRDALEYYNSVKVAAKQKIHGAEVEYELLKKYFRRSKSSSGNEPTEEQVNRDVRALMHGTKEGRIVIENENPSVSAGRRKVTDDTYREHIASREVSDIEENK